MSKSARKTLRLPALVAACTAAALAFSGCSGSDSDASGGAENTVKKPVASAIDKTMQQVMQASKSTQAIVGVWMPNGNAYVASYGENAPKPSAKIHAAEATAPAVCAVLLQLVDRGKLQLDRKVSADLPQQVGIKNVTYGDLCQGISGLAEYKTELWPFANRVPTRQWPMNELLAGSLADSPLPGKGKDAYVSDADIVMLAKALEVSQRTPIADLLDEYVFEPANMKHSYYPEFDRVKQPKRAMAQFTYPFAGGKPVCKAKPAQVDRVSSTFLGGAGATITTVSDLHKFYRAYFNGEFGVDLIKDKRFNPRSLVHPKRDKNGKVTEKVPPPKKGEVRPAYAFGMKKVGPLYGRAGRLPGAITAAYTEPTSGFTVVVTLNNSGASREIATAAAFSIAAKLEKEAKLKIPWSAQAQNKQIADLAICQ